ncbi:hypothetical protein QO179_18350 [Bacillus stercoris]|nr:hypothetical protein [Bacillus stercoris]
MEESRLMKYEIDENGYIIKGYEPDAKDIPDGVVDAWEGSGFLNQGTIENKGNGLKVLPRRKLTRF